MSFARHLEFISKVEPEERGHREGGSCLIAPPDREFVLPSPGALKSTKQKVLNLEISNHKTLERRHLFTIITS